MCVEVVRDRPHVVIDEVLISVVLVHDVGQSPNQNDPDLLRGIRVVLFPDDHRHEARLALGDPAQSSS